MTRVRVVTDSTACLDPGVIEKLNITVLPMQIHLGTETLMDGPDLDKEMFFRRMARSPVPPQSVSPSVDVFERTFVELNQTNIVEISMIVLISCNLVLASQTHGQLISGATLMDFEFGAHLHTMPVRSIVGWRDVLHVSDNGPIEHAGCRRMELLFELITGHLKL